MSNSFQIVVNKSEYKLFASCKCKKSDAYLSNSVCVTIFPKGYNDRVVGTSSPMPIIGRRCGHTSIRALFRYNIVVICACAATHKNLPVCAVNKEDLTK